MNYVLAAAFAALAIAVLVVLGTGLWTFRKGDPLESRVVGIGVAVALAGCALMSLDVRWAFWLTPVAVIAMLAVIIRRTVRDRRRG
ncbi:hypothetical protein [Actinomadura rupiterrae]|uniref:hypothetical protein n=1 Tax=Actinomadura rupiterrae TaxID=559627 RepID=UPI0020A350D2|nr:hypothetical protein [Actinomadura rupiterrae]MCP2342908.1 CHASE2 domain-containing sensor protein [Actinomadura rupiterrae]